MRKLLPIFILSILIASTSLHSNSARAAVAYSWSYDFANVYNISDITYSFTNLDSTVDYAWNVYTIDTRDGSPVTALGAFISLASERTAAGHATTETLVFGSTPTIAPAGQITFPDNYTGPIGLFDDRGTQLGVHFVEVVPDYLTTPDSQWFDGGSGNTSLGERQVMGNISTTGICRNPVYNAFNSDGWQHSFAPCSVVTLDGGWAILNYQIATAYDPATDDDVINFYRIPDSTVIFSVSLNELIAFQQTAAYSPGGMFGFIVVNTSSTYLPFIDNTRCAAAFTAGMNPCIANMGGTGVYNYSRYDSTPSWVSDGESVWMISNDPSLQEWRITANNQTIAGGQRQTVTTYAVTPEVWNSYHGAQTIFDGFQGIVNSTVYSFATTRSISYTTAVAVNDNTTVAWTNQAISINSGLATPAEMAFVVTTTYNLVANTTFEENVNQVMVNTGLDTPAGRGALLTIILVVGMLGTATFSGLRANIYAYLIVWTGLGAVFVLGGFGTALVNTVFMIATVVMWIAALTLAPDSNENF